MSPFRPSRRSTLKGAASLFGVAAVATPGLARVAPKPDPFIEHLIAAMSVEEKAGQLSIFIDTTRGQIAAVNPQAAEQNKVEMLRQIADGRITGVFNGLGVAGARELQSVAVNQSRHKIPLIFAGDIIHGMKTSFPIPLGESASFDPDLCQRTARATAVEATALGFHWTFAPMVDIARDQRWGRVSEGAGEDVYLGKKLAEARVKGFQGERLDAEDSLLACPKHFAAYGAVQGGMEYNTADIPETTLRETHLPPFKAAFDSGALTTMSSFNDIGGVPSTGNHYLLTDILRGEWGFKGLVVSDYTSDQEMIAHGFARDDADAAAKAINAGCDISMQSGIYNAHLPALVKSGKVSMKVLDQAVRRVLYVKKAIGLFDNPYRCLDLEKERAYGRSASTIALARESARKAIVLLKNKNNLLPLKKAGQRIALIGPFGADRDNLAGPWSIFADMTLSVSIEEGLRNALSSPSFLTTVVGAEIDADLPGGIEAAVQAAQASDVVVLALGESQNMSGEAQARTDIGIPEAQLRLAEAVAKAGKPMIVLLRHGRALALKGAVRDADAIVATWFLGSETGHAIADILFGDFSPQGRLPVSFPQESGQEPFYYNRRTTGRPQVEALEPSYKTRYREVSNDALYPFGHGLSYANITYGETRVNKRDVSQSEAVTVSVLITNTGQRSVHEVAQLYIHQRVASLTQPMRSLKGFKHIDLAPGQTETVDFTLNADDLAFMGQSLKKTFESGEFMVWISPSATAGTPALFQMG